MLLLVHLDQQPAQGKPLILLLLGEVLLPLVLPLPLIPLP